MDYRTFYLKALAKLFPDAALREQADVIMSQYSDNDGLRGKTAILKVAGSDLNEIRRCTEAACRDYRDVLSWAEYPEQLEAGFGANDPAMLNRDRKQYQTWIDGIEAVQQSPERDR